MLYTGVVFYSSNYIHGESGVRSASILQYLLRCHIIADILPYMSPFSSSHLIIFLFFFYRFKNEGRGRDFTEDILELIFKKFMIHYLYNYINLY